MNNRFKLEKVDIKCVNRVHLKTPEKAANSDAKMVEYAQRSRANINSLRRYEKDLFLNIDDPTKVDEYEKKWDEL